MINNIKQSAGNNSENINSGRDTSITNITNVINEVIDYDKLTTSVVEIVIDAFPILRNEAFATGRILMEDTAKFLMDEIKKLKESAEHLKSKLSEPDIQFSINELLYISAKKGNKIDRNVLVSLIVKKLETGVSDEQDFLLDEAITISSKLTRQQIEFLGFIFYVKSINYNYGANSLAFGTYWERVDPADMNLRENHDSFILKNSFVKKSYVYEAYMKIYTNDLEFLFKDIKSVSKINLTYLSLKNCIGNLMLGGQGIEHIVSKRTGTREEDFNKEFKFLQMLLKKYGVENTSNINLTEIGNIIAIAYLNSKGLNLPIVN
ncbi:TPA: hypothetical protein SMS53_001197 [Proteus mirabilis]|uniref:LPO_1073/Vpar_1526 family protein n=2 Tax=Morganellaceae TaxID=1903414 RepID=UPI000D687158|nr:MULTISPECIES: LPO_1073/Vpar_1526 family protein [Proteus]AZF93084.1 MAG: hypothetical protein [Phage NV21]ELA7719585.1 hypothetical protein [Proteus mirabilis]EMA1120481.1 hypothetical protein [Proteus mirabilis]MBI6274953.1 hypothetical protein [Proteus mirabilis]MBI6518403.1 hypothetical protein [Proteus mirabilis]